MTVKPNFDARDRFVEVQSGSEAHLNLKGSVSVPLVAKTFAVRILTSRIEGGGYMENLTTGSDLNDRDRHSLRGQFLFDNDEGFTARIIADGSELEEKC